MPDWTKSMQQTYEYYIVDPGTWKDIKKLDIVKTSNITRDSETDTLESATIDIVGSLGECYVRVYLVTIQNGVEEKHPLGTFLVQTSSSTFDGKKNDVPLDAYSPLLELKENPPPLGYSIEKDENVMNMAYRLVREQARAPVVQTECSETLHGDFVSNTDDKWITFISDLVTMAKYKLGLDELSRIIFLPAQELEAMQPVWTYNVDDESILYPELSTKHDLYGVPNVVEVIYNTSDQILTARVVNDDSNSPTSTVSRGREIIHRVNNPQLTGNPNQQYINEYAEKLLKELSTVEYKLTYTHAYCPVRVGDCVRLNYSKAGISGVKAKVISQSIKCEPGCPVSETAVFTSKLWR